RPTDRPARNLADICITLLVCFQTISSCDIFCKVGPHNNPSEFIRRRPVTSSRPAFINHRAAMDLPFGIFPDLSSVRWGLEFELTHGLARHKLFQNSHQLRQTAFLSGDSEPHHEKPSITITEVRERITRKLPGEWP